MAEKLALEITPLDPLFFRDGRPFDATSRVVSSAPKPQTVAGALRSFLLQKTGCDFAALSRAAASGATLEEAFSQQGDIYRDIYDLRINGPFMRKSGSTYLPSPGHLMRDADDGSYYLLSPLKESLPGWQANEHTPLPLWHRGMRMGKPAGGFIDLEGMELVLNGSAIEESHQAALERFSENDYRVGIAIDPDTGHTIEGKIYSATFLAYAPDVSLYVELKTVNSELDKLLTDGGIVRLGGEGKRAALAPVEPITWPRSHEGGDGDMLIALTPFDTAVLDTLDRESLISTVIPSYLPVSGWDYARGGPKPTRFMAAAGSAVFLNTKNTITTLAGSRDRNDGWGVTLPGSWNYV